MRSSVKIDTKVWDKLLERAVEMRGAAVKIGVQGAEASETHEGGEFSNAQVAAVHEFHGPADTPPGRPFIRPVYENDPNKWQAKLRDACLAVIKGASANGELRKIGEEFRKEVIERIKAHIPPALALSTLMARNAKHGGTHGRPSGYQQRGEKEERTGRPAVDDTPLVDTGTLLGAISVQVEKK